jgi:HlyD family secretion protein
LEQSPPLGQPARLLLQGRAASFRLSPFEGLTLLVLLAVTAFGGYTAYARLTDLNAVPAAAPTYIPAFRSTLTSTVSSTGTVQASQQVTLTFGSAGKVKEFLVGLGAEVKAGQALARIDDVQLQQALKSAETALASAQSRLDSARLGPTVSDIASGQQTLATANSQVATAQKNLDDLLARPTAADIAAGQQAVLSAQNAVQSAQDAKTKAQTDLTTAQSNLATAQKDVSEAYDDLRFERDNLRRANDACKEDDISVPSLPALGSVATTVQGLSFGFECDPITGPTGVTDAAKTALSSHISAFNAAARAYNTTLTAQTTAQNALTTAQNAVNNGNLDRAIQNAQIGLATAEQKLAETRAGATQFEIDAARRGLDSAQAALLAAQARYDELFKPPAQDVILPLRAAVDQAAADVEEAKANLAAATIVAPFEGRISQVTGEVGTQVTATTPVFILLNPNLVRIDAQVDQADVSKLRAGQTAVVTFDALTGQAYQATITAIGLTPTTQQGVVTYAVSLAVDTSRLAPGQTVPAPGMTASITITTNRTENALVVPARAIRRVGRAQTVTVRTPNGDEQRPVTTGVTNGTLTQVLSGLQEGDEVLVSAPRTTTTTGQQPQGNPFFTGPGGGGGGPGIAVPVR